MMLRKGHILAILVIGFSFVIIPIFAQELADFVDPEKDPKSYLDRYYSKPDYREWFDKNYPDITIEEAVGLVESYSQIQEKWGECARNARIKYDENVKNYITSGGSPMNYETQVTPYFQFLYPCIGKHLEQLNDAGVILAEMELYKESIVYYDKALYLFPQYLEDMYFSGRTYAELGEYEKATSLYDKIVEIDPSADLSKERDYVTIQLKNENSEIICGAGTVMNEKGQCVSASQSKGGGCLISTATFGSELAPQVQQLREIRDNSLLQTELTSTFLLFWNFKFANTEFCFCFWTIYSEFGNGSVYSSFKIFQIN